MYVPDTHLIPPLKIGLNTPVGILIQFKQKLKNLKQKNMKTDVIKSVKFKTIELVYDAQGKVKTLENGTTFLRIVGFNQENRKLDYLLTTDKALRSSFGNHLRKHLTLEQTIEKAIEMFQGECVSQMRDEYQEGELVSLVGNISEDTMEKVSETDDDTLFVVNQGYTIAKLYIAITEDEKSLEREALAEARVRAEMKKSSVMFRPVVIKDEPKEEPKDEILENILATKKVVKSK